MKIFSNYGDFYIFDKRTDNFSVSNANLRGKFNFLAGSARRNNLLLHDVALSVARVAHGDLSDELARINRIYPRNDRFADSRTDFFAVSFFFR